MKKLVSSPHVNKEDFKQTLQQAMKEKGLDTKLRNTVFHWVRTQSKQNVSIKIICYESNECVRDGTITFSNFVLVVRWPRNSILTCIAGCWLPHFFRVARTRFALPTINILYLFKSLTFVFEIILWNFRLKNKYNSSPS